MPLPIGLSMIVRDEARQLAACLDPIIGLLDDVTVVDTGSTDGTCDLLRERYGIEPLRSALDSTNCNSKSPARNLGYEHCRSDWIIRIDADERLTAEDVATLRALEPDALTGGYFVEWLTHRGASATQDYKLLLFRKGVRSTGCAHENMQVDIRDRGLHAHWIDGLVLEHYPDVEKDPWKATFYRERLECAIARTPDWYRYHWFLGYASFCRGEAEQAAHYLRAAADSRSHRFPVECLNAHMVLAALHAQAGDRDAVLHVLEAMERFHATVRDDFEVAVNTHLEPWLHDARAAAADGRLADVQPRGFAT